MNASYSPTINEIKSAIAVQLQMDDNIRYIAGHLPANRDFMYELLMSYHQMDTKAVFGAQHVLDFFTRFNVGPDEFTHLIQSCHNDRYNFVLLMRGTQMGVIPSADIQAHLECNANAVPFDFAAINQKVKDRGVKLIRI